jgi:hypothetical protein
MARWFDSVSLLIIEDGGEYVSPDGTCYPASFPKADIPHLVPYEPIPINAAAELETAKQMRKLDVQYRCADNALHAELIAQIDAAATPEEVRAVTW